MLVSMTANLLWWKNCMFVGRGHWKLLRYVRRMFRYVCPSLSFHIYVRTRRGRLNVPLSIYLCDSSGWFPLLRYSYKLIYRFVQGLVFSWGDFIPCVEFGYSYDIHLSDIWRLVFKIIFLGDCQNILCDKGVYLWHLMCLLGDKVKWYMSWGPEIYFLQ